MGLRAYRCEFDGKLVPSRLMEQPYRGMRRDNICFVSNGADIAELSQGAELATIERWGTSCCLSEPAITWFQTYIVYFKRLMFERLEHIKDDDAYEYDLAYFSADEVLMKNGTLMEDTPYSFSLSPGRMSSGPPTFDPKNQEKMSWCGEDIWHKLNENGEWIKNES